MAVDYLSALNVGSGLNVTQIVDAIVDAERVPQENIIQRKIDEKTVSVSALGQLKGIFCVPRQESGRNGWQNWPW